MRTARARHTAVLIVGVLAAAAFLHGQDRGTAPVIVPVEKEPQHRPVFENDVVAVLDVRFPPGYVSLFHTHANDNVSVRLETSLARIDTLSSQGEPQTALVGRVVFNTATPPYTHRVANIGDQPIRILDIEILARRPVALAAVPDEVAGHDVVTENARVRLTRILVPSGASYPAHAHPRGRVEVVVRGAKPGTFVWRAAGARADAIAGGTAGAEIVEIEIK